MRIILCHIQLSGTIQDYFLRLVTKVKDQYGYIYNPCGRIFQTMSNCMLILSLVTATQIGRNFCCYNIKKRITWE